MLLVNAIDDHGDVMLNGDSARIFFMIKIPIRARLVVILVRTLAIVITLLSITSPVPSLGKHRPLAELFAWGHCASSKTLGQDLNFRLHAGLTIPVPFAADARQL